MKFDEVDDVLSALWLFEIPRNGNDRGLHIIQRSGGQANQRPVCCTKLHQLQPRSFVSDTGCRLDQARRRISTRPKDISERELSDEFITYASLSTQCFRIAFRYASFFLIFMVYVYQLD